MQQAIAGDLPKYRSGFFLTYRPLFPASYILSTRFFTTFARIELQIRVSEITFNTACKSHALLFFSQKWNVAFERKSLACRLIAARSVKQRFYKTSSFPIHICILIPRGSIKIVPDTLMHSLINYIIMHMI